MSRRIVAAALGTALMVMPLWAHGAERKSDALAVQVALDRLGFSPGVIDGAMGGQTQKALRGFQEANGLEITGQLDEDTRAARGAGGEATMIVAVADEDAAGPFAKIP